MQFLGCQKRESVLQIEPHLIAKHSYCASPSTVVLMCPFPKDTFKQIQILSHRYLKFCAKIQKWSEPQCDSLHLLGTNMLNPLL